VQKIGTQPFLVRKVLCLFEGQKDTIGFPRKKGIGTVLERCIGVSARISPSP